MRVVTTEAGLTEEVTTEAVMTKAVTTEATSEWRTVHVARDLSETTKPEMVYIQGYPLTDLCSDLTTVTNL